ncbi:MAG: CoA transferase [Clostridiales bacterium]|nr:CoA transferase [Clostridiales bacterium]
MNRRLLEDITIVDLTWVMAGPGATKLFNDLGARVIRIESNKTLDVLRTGCQRKNNDSFYKEGGWVFQDFNHDKLDIALNLKSPGGREVFEELVKIADIVVCNYGVKAFRKLGLTFEDLSKIKEDIIVLNASGLGDYGPYSSYITYAPSLMSVTGLIGLYGYEGADTPEMPTPLADYFGSLTLANYMLAAIEYRRRTGHGQFVDVGQGDGVTAFLGPAIISAQANGVKYGRIGNRDWSETCVPHNVYRCKGDDDWQWCAIACAGEEEWQKLRGVIDPEDEWSGAEEFATHDARLANVEALDEHILAWTAERTPEEVGRLCQAAGVSGAPVQTNYDLIHRDEHLRERGFFCSLDLEPEGKYPENFEVTNMVARMSNVERPVRFHHAPAWGEHTEYILKEILGKTQEWIDNNLIL